MPNRSLLMNDILSANIDIGLGVVIGVLSAIPVAAVIYVAESELFAGLRLKLSRRKAAHIRPAQRQAEASVTRPSSASEASIG
jgi:hypothetical protein